jgi:hypothetical protein
MTALMPLVDDDEWAVADLALRANCDHLSVPEATALHAVAGTRMYLQKGKPLLGALRRRHPRPKFAASPCLPWDAAGSKQGALRRAEKKKRSPVLWASNHGLDPCLLVPFPVLSPDPCPRHCPLQVVMYTNMLSSPPSLHAFPHCLSTSLQALSLLISSSLAHTLPTNHHQLPSSSIVTFRHGSP